MSGQGSVKSVVIGSQTFGGAGKTPVALYIVRTLLTKGINAGLLVRPTKAGPVFEGCVTTVADARASGDEATMLWQELPDGTPLFVFKDLGEGQRFASHLVDVLVIDDGLRVRELSCDLSIVVVDHSSTESVFPLGPCRESNEFLDKMDVIWLNKVDEPRRRTDVSAHVRSSYQALELVNQNGETLSLDQLKSKPVTICSGIGRPESFYHTLRPWLDRVVNIFEYGDHELYIFPQTSLPGELIVTTEKDLARNSGGSDVWALRTQLHLESGASYLKQRLEDLITA
ncbi:MAG: tetraacyldisaccharide 4'-kinase [Bradymonadia bacterium]